MRFVLYPSNLSARKCLLHGFSQLQYILYNPEQYKFITLIVAAACQVIRLVIYCTCERNDSIFHLYPKYPNSLEFSLLIFLKGEL